MKTMNESSEKIEFEDDAPLELTDSESFVDQGSKSLSEIDNALKKKNDQKEKIKRMKEKPPALNLRISGKLKPQNPKDYIVVHCNLCEHDFQHAKKDDSGALMPYALCQHIVFKGVIVEK